MKKVFFGMILGIVVSGMVFLSFLFLSQDKTQTGIFSPSGEQKASQDTVLSDDIPDIENPTLKERAGKDFEEKKINETLFSYINEKLEGTKKISPEIQQAFKNLDTYKGSNKVQVSYRLGVYLLFPLHKATSCGELSQSLGLADPQGFEENCEIQDFVKTYFFTGKLPETKREDTIISALKNKACPAEEFVCATLFDETLSREKFQQALNEKIPNEKEKLSELQGNIQPSAYSYAAFFDDIANYGVKDISDIFYDHSLFYAAMYTKDVKRCDEIYNNKTKLFCQDYFSQENSQKYEDLFYDFFSELYIRNLNQ